ncbi:MAG: type II/IV secretion system ATPase subunit, partial [Nanoarchaeota archaeon]|nr:type II/IV secretion system ATPase subunit [Nanoarchaeota archaeon]
LKHKPVEGVSIPTHLRIGGKSFVLEENTELRKGLNLKYPLIPKKPAQGEIVYAQANIKWNPHINQLTYSVIEPPLTQYDLDVIRAIKTDLEERLDVDFTKLGQIQAKNVLTNNIYDSMMSLFPDIDPMKKKIIEYYIEKEIIGLGKIEPLMKDSNIEDISCDGVQIPLYIYHRNPRISSIKTNVMFTTCAELDNFVSKLAQKCNKSITIAEPLLDATLPDGSRVQATLGTDIAKRGSNFTIRKFTDKPLTPTHLLKYGSVDSTQMAYLWLAVDNGKSILISGGSATGKTSMLNSLSLFIRPNLKVVSIEDTSELRLPLPHWVSHVARTPIDTAGKVGEVSLFDLLKSSLRQRPDYIIVGEVRGKEAYVLFQQMATGHSSLATIHAASIPQLIDRLITPPISLPPTLLENIDIIVFLGLSRLNDRYVRRIDNIIEITGVKNEQPMSNTIFKWKPMTDKFETVDNSVVLKEIARKLGITEDTIQDEIMRRKKVLEWMVEREIFDYMDFAKIVSLYYSDPEKIMDMTLESL